MTAKVLYIYVLKLENDKWYVGKTENVQNRIEQHINGVGAEWTRLYPVIECAEFFEMKSEFDEDMYVLRYMKNYGIENVRGGCFCQTILTQPMIDHINKMIRSSNDTCFKCGEKGHFARNCFKKHTLNEDEFVIVDPKLKENTQETWWDVAMDFLETATGMVEILQNNSAQRCYRCKREGHFLRDCYATTDIYGNRL